MCPSAPRVCSEPGGQKPVLSLSLDLIDTNWNRPLERYVVLWGRVVKKRRNRIYLVKHLSEFRLGHVAIVCQICSPLQWRHNEHNGVSNHRRLDCLLNRLFRHRSKKTLKLRVTGLCAGNSPGPVNSPHKGPVTRKMFPFDDVIMAAVRLSQRSIYGQNAPVSGVNHNAEFCMFGRNQNFLTHHLT